MMRLQSPTSARRSLTLPLSSLAILAAGSAALLGSAAGFAATPAAQTAAAAPAAASDPYAWLEEVDGERALAWVREQNARTEKDLQARPLYSELYKQALAVLDAESRLPDVTQRGEWIYSLWQDAEHPRGLYRRTSLHQLREKETTWEPVLDLDKLSASEGKPWVFKGMRCLSPSYRQCLVLLSPGGGDAVEVREWDMDKLAFVADGFKVPLAKTNVGWRDADTLFLGTDFGPGTMTSSGYPRVVKLWKRGTPMSAAKTVYEAPESSYSTSGFRLRSSGGDVDLISDGVDFWNSRNYQLVGDTLHQLTQLPLSAEIDDVFDGRLVIVLHEEWKRPDATFPAGAVLIADPKELWEGGGGRVDVVIAPTANEVVEGVDASPTGIVATLLDSVRGRLYHYRPDPAKKGSWTREAIAFPDNGALAVESIDDKSGDLFVTFQSFVSPPTLYHVAGGSTQPEPVKQQQATFDGSKFEVTQQWATSKDGTKVPYFQVAPKGMALDGSHPTHIFSYGGFRNALTPSYSGSYEHLSGAYGKLWLDRGGVFVLANIRGGGEFGPRWHAAALRENRVKAFEDFEAVAADLAQRKVTTPTRIGIEGRSNGGLLVLSTMVRRPELYGAIICGSPLADMRGYHKMLAGASWMAEYGDPDKPEDWKFLGTYSPYQTARPGKKYPPIFFYLSTRDDRVHPGHARKMAARLMEMGYRVWYWELIEGGHGASVTHEQLAHRLALAYTHLWGHLAGK